MSFFNDNPLTVPVQWFFCDEDAEPFPADTIFGSTNWASDQKVWSGIGEVFGATRRWNYGYPPRVIAAVNLNGDPYLGAWHGTFNSQDPTTYRVLFDLDTPAFIEIGQRVIFSDGGRISAVIGPFEVVDVPNPLQLVIVWPHPIAPDSGMQRDIFSSAVILEFGGDEYFGTIKQFQEGASYDLDEVSETDEFGSNLPTMHVPQQAFLIIVGITNPGQTGHVAGDVLTFTFNPDGEARVGFLGRWDCDETYIYSSVLCRPIFCRASGWFGTGLSCGNGQSQPFPPMDPWDAFSLDLRTFYWFAWSPIFPGLSSPLDEHWNCIVTFDEPGSVPPPGPPYPMFPGNFWPPGFWPDAMF